MQVALRGTGIVTSSLALGCARLGSVLTPLSPGQAISLLHEAEDLGIRHFDTASVYGQGDSERMIGKAFRERRSRICIASKAGQRLSSLHAMLAPLKAPIRIMAKKHNFVRNSVGSQRAGAVQFCFDADYIERALHGSLRRLRTDHLDIFYLHAPTLSALSDEGLFERIRLMRGAGKFRAFGVSCDDLAVAARAALLAEVEVVQFKPDGSESTAKTIDAAARTGKVVMVRGLIDRDATALHQTFSAALADPAITGVIVGTNSVQHLRQNVAAFRAASSEHSKAMR